MKLRLALLLLAAGAASAPAAGVEFRHIAFGTPLDVKPREGEKLTEQVRRFHATGKNPYDGAPKAIAAGKALYEEHCQSCHMPDGSGRIGPPLTGERPIYPRTATDVGMFEAVYGGAMGAMQSFKPRMTQDEMLKLIAYVRTLKKRSP